MNGNIYSFMIDKESEETFFIDENQVYKNIVQLEFKGGNISKAFKIVKRELSEEDKSGKPIYLHAIRIASALDLIGYNEDYIVTGYLHDILEDSKNFDSNELLNFNRNVRKAIQSLTRKKSETYFEYIEKISKGSDLAKKVKQLDVYDHLFYKSSINESLIRRYERASEILNINMSNNVLIEEKNKWTD